MMRLILILLLMLTTTANATVIFQYDGESGYQYMGSTNAHPGGGYFLQMGGNISAPEGVYDASACTPDTTNYHYSVLSNDVAAQGASTGSTHAIKTPYLGVCPNEAFQRDTTIIMTPLLQEYWIKWDQKWTGSFQASQQQKFAKFYYSGDTTEHAISGYFVLRPGTTTTGLYQAYFQNVDELLDRECPSMSTAQVWISPVGPCSLPTHSYDSSSETTTPIIFELDRWYTIKIHSKMNSANDVADAVFEIWVDGVLRLQLTNFKIKNGVDYTSPGTDRFELQHIYYDRSSVDQTTYMDNIIISDTALGGETPADTTPPVVTPSKASGSQVSSKFSLTLSTSDNVGVASTQYCVAAIGSDCTPTTAYGSGVTVYPGQHVKSHVCDAAGNCMNRDDAYPWTRGCK